MNTSDQDKTVRRGKSKKVRVAQAVGGAALVASLTFGGASLLSNTATPSYAQTATQAATPSSSSSGTTNTAPQTQATPSGTPSTGTNGNGPVGPGGRGKGGPGPAGGPGHGGPGGLGGTISSINGNTITVKRDNVIVIQATVNSSTVYKDAGTTISLSDLKVGEQVQIRENRATDGTTSIAEVDVVYDHAGGTISATASDSLTLTRPDNTTQKISLSSSTTYTDLGKTISLGDLKSGVKVDVEGTLNSDGSLSAKVVRVQHDHLGGTVTAINGNSITVQVGPDGGRGPGGPKGGPGGRGPAGQGQNGSSLLQGGAALAGNAQGQKTATAGSAPSTSNSNSTASSGNTSTAPVTTTKTITVSSGTVYLASGQSAKLSDITVGSRINAEGTISSDGNSLTALQVTIQLPSYRGQVTAVSGNTITLTDRGGTHTVVVDSNTKYLNGTATAALSDVKTGVTLEAQGKLDSSGKLTATTIQLGQPQPPVPGGR